MIYEGKQKLGDFFSSRRERGEAGLPTLSVTLENGLVKRDSLERKTDTNLEPEEHLLVHKGDIAYNMMRMWQGALGLASEKGIVSPAYIVLKPKKNIDSEFAFHLFKTRKFIHRFWAYSYGLTSDRLRLYFNDFSKIPVTVPSLEEQTKIAKILSAWDKAIETVEALIENSKAQKKALMQQLLTGEKRLSGFNKPWQDSTFGEIAEIDTGFAFRSADFTRDTTNSFPIVRMSDFKEGINLEESARVPQSVVKGLGKYSLKEGDFVFGMSGSLENYAWVKEKDLPCYLNQRVGRIRAKKGFDHLFITYLYLSAPVQNRISDMAAGAAQLNISINDLRLIKIKLPDHEEQKRISEILSSIDIQIEKLKKNLSSLIKEKKFLMQQLLSGKRRVKADIDKPLSKEAANA